MSTFEQWNPQPVLLLVGLVAGERRADVAGEVVVQIWKGEKKFVASFCSTDGEIEVCCSSFPAVFSRM